MVTTVPPPDSTMVELVKLRLVVTYDPPPRQTLPRFTDVSPVPPGW